MRHTRSAGMLFSRSLANGLTRQDIRTVIIVRGNRLLKRRRMILRQVRRRATVSMTIMKQHHKSSVHRFTTFATIRKRNNNVIR